MGLYEYLFSLLNEDERCLQITPSIFLERTDEGNELNIDTDLVGVSMEVKSIKSDDEFVIINGITAACHSSLFLDIYTQIYKISGEKHDESGEICIFAHDLSTHTKLL